jgi:hypothetical protein
MRVSPEAGGDAHSSPAVRTAHRSHRRRWGGLLVVLLLTGFAAATARLFIWPSLDPLPDHADAIIELGGPGDRDAVTMSLAEQHLAPLVIKSISEDETTFDSCLPPIPDVTIDCHHAVPPTTRGEARYIGDRAAAEHWESVIIVTTPDHAWRARLRVERCFPGDVYVATSPLPEWDWLRQIPYQWAATVKAELFERDC